ncbi:MAG: 2-oxoacid:acceptor oxidoreductase family protein [SAR324 cluster bacterium]|nr:2-oxoacid:acceptor oxidoreductase family protein [SAR324 cluster bacterium]
MDIKIILCGIGGQGVVFLNRLLARAAMDAGFPVMSLESHGMSRRGGSVVLHLRLGSHESPLVSQGGADLLLALDAQEGLRNLSFVKSGGMVIVNSKDEFPAEVSTELKRLKIKTHSINATELARKMGKATAANVILAGCTVALSNVSLTKEALQESVALMSPKAAKLNNKAIEIGYNTF